MNTNLRLRVPALLAACLAAAPLAACHRHHHLAANTGLCADFKTAANGQPITANIPATGSDAAAPVDDCVRRWAYSLASARDQADVVAQSAVAACVGPLTRWNQATLAQPATGAGSADGAQGDGVQGVSLASGEPTSPLSAHADFAQQRALLYVVEARAGDCAPPPVSNGVPVGAS